MCYAIGRDIRKRWPKYFLLFIHVCWYEDIFAANAIVLLGSQNKYYATRTKHRSSFGTPMLAVLSYNYRKLNFTIKSINAALRSVFYQHSTNHIETRALILMENCPSEYQIDNYTWRVYVDLNAS